MRKLIMALLLCTLLVLTSCSEAVKSEHEAVEKTLPEYVSYTVLPVDYSLEDAIADRCTVLVDYVMSTGETEWNAFIELTQKGEAAMIRLAHYYTQSARLYLTDLEFDGSVYTVSDYSDSDLNGQFTYLKHFVNIVGTDQGGPTLDCYMLLNEEIENYNDIDNTLASSGGSFDAYRIYMKQIPGAQPDGTDAEQPERVWDSAAYSEMLKAYLDRNGLPEDYALEEAVADGCVAWVDTEIQSGENVWLGFAETALGGKSASVRLAKFYSTHSVLYFTDIAYDGSIYTVTEMDGTSKQFKYLNDYELPEDGRHYAKFDSYVLVNDKEVGYSDLGWAQAGINGSPYIEQYRISAVNYLYLNALSKDGDIQWTYPVTPGDIGWADLSYTEALASLNIPENQLTEQSGEELADMVLEYPHLIDIGAYSDMRTGFNTVIGKSSVCRRFFMRDDAMDIMLTKYDELAVDYRVNRDLGENSRWTLSGSMKENFLGTYFYLNFDTLTPEQEQKLKRVFYEKYEIRKAANLTEDASRMPVSEIWDMMYG